MNNEPVAWIGKDELQFGFTDTRVTNEKESWDDIPLYTHPAEHDLGIAEAIGFEKGYKAASAKTLTDEEIKSEAKYFCHSYHSENPERLVLFARAILRKAQEK